MLKKSRQSSKEEHQDSDTGAAQNRHPDQPRKWNNPVGIFLGIALGVSVASQVLYLNLPIYWIVAGFACFIAAGLLVSYLLLQKVVWPALGNYSSKARFLWVSLCMLAGFFLVLTIPIMVYPKPQVIRIVATGDKNPASKSSEVWLNNIITGGRASPVHLNGCTGNWSISNTSLVSVKDLQPSELVCVIRTDQDIDLQFGMHDWSGKVRLIFEDHVIEEDLYSADWGLKQIQLYSSYTLVDQFIRFFLFIANGIAIGFLLLAALLRLARYPVNPIIAGEIKPVRWFFYALPMATSWMIYLLVFWPGFFSPDTLDQFGQIATGKYNDWHPAFHTLFLWLTTRLWFSPTPAVIAQVVFLSGLLGWGLSMIQSKGTPKWVAWAIALFLAISPAIGLILLNPWKDVAYGIVLLAMTLMIFYIINCKEIDKKIGVGFWVLLVLVSSFVALFRHNGWPVAFGTLLLLVLIDRRRWKSYLIVLILSVLIWRGVKGPLYEVVRVHNNPATQTENLNLYYRALYLILAHEQAGTYLSPEEKAILSEFTLQEGIYPAEVVIKHMDDLSHMAVTASLRNPFETFRYFLTRASFIFQILQPSRNRIEHVGLGVSPNPYGLIPNSKLPFLKSYFYKIDSLSESPDNDWLFWRNAFWMYLLVSAGVIVSIRLKTWKYWAVLIPIFLNALPLALVSSGQISRYIFPTLLVGPLFGIGLLFIQPVLTAPQQTGKLDIPDLDHTSSRA